MAKHLSVILFCRLTLQNIAPLYVDTASKRRQGKNNRLSPFRRWARIENRIQVSKVIQEGIRKCVRTMGPIGWRNSSVSQTCPYLRSVGPARRMLCDRVVKLALSRANLRSGLPWRDSHCCFHALSTLGLSFTFTENYRAYNLLIFGEKSPRGPESSREDLEGSTSFPRSRGNASHKPD